MVDIDLAPETTAELKRAIAQAVAEEIILEDLRVENVRLHVSNTIEKNWTIIESLFAFDELVETDYGASLSEHEKQEVVNTESPTSAVVKDFVHRLLVEDIVHHFFSPGRIDIISYTAALHGELESQHDTDRLSASSIVKTFHGNTDYKWDTEDFNEAHVRRLETFNWQNEKLRKGIGSFVFSEIGDAQSEKATSSHNV